MQKSPEKQIDYLIKITDKIGIFEHTKRDQPDFAEGYCVDDNARALQVYAKFGKEFPQLNESSKIWFSFVKSAIRNNKLGNDLEKGRWMESTEPKGEHYGRALWALGELIKSGLDKSEDAKLIFDEIYSTFETKKSPFPRVMAQIILALQNYHIEDMEVWADQLNSYYLQNKSNDWKWFDDVISYDVGRVPLALMTASDILTDKKYLVNALEMLNFLTGLIFDDKLDCFVFPGNNGWFTKSGERNIYSQQPIEAGSITEAFSKAYKITSDKKYLELARLAFDWYGGKNIVGKSLINNETGGIYDGFDSTAVNLNQGAESVLAYLLAFDAVRKLNEPTK